MRKRNHNQTSPSRSLLFVLLSLAVASTLGLSWILADDETHLLSRIIEPWSVVIVYLTVIRYAVQRPEWSRARSLTFAEGSIDDLPASEVDGEQLSHRALALDFINALAKDERAAIQSITISIDPNNEKVTLTAAGERKLELSVEEWNDLHDNVLTGRFGSALEIRYANEFDNRCFIAFVVAILSFVLGIVSAGSGASGLTWALQVIVGVALAVAVVCAVKRRPA